MPAMRSHLVVGLVIVAGALVACQPVKSSAPPCAPSPTFAQELFELVNRERVAHGVAPVEWRQDLADFGTWHAGRMAAAGRIYHSTPAEQAAHGFNVGTPRGTGVYENVAGGNPDCSALTAAAFHGAFMASPAHRANILDSAHDALGVGLAFDGHPWVAQEFGQDF